MKNLLYLASSAGLAILLATACAPQPASPTAAPQAAIASSPTPHPDSSPTPASLGPGDHEQSLMFDGRTRDYILHLPPGYDGTKSLPLMFVLHGYGDTARNTLNTIGMNERADQDNFIVAYLSGTGSPRLAWNTGITPGLVDGVDDVGFVRTLIDQFTAELHADPKRIYAAGSSMGAMMTYRLGAELSDQLAGIAIVSGTVGSKLPNGTILTVPTTGGPIPVIAFHGKADPTLPYDGGPGDAGAGLSWLSVADSVAFSVRQNGCTGQPEVTTSADGNVITDDYTHCADGSEVLTYTIVSAGHLWPTPERDAKMSASDAIWEFFARHPRAD